MDRIKEVDNKEIKDEKTINDSMAKKDESRIKKKKSQLTGVSIVRVAAFSFAIVSWYATSAGLSNFVFESKWQSGLVSFGIQAILFVFNLKLPYYYHRIGKNSNRTTKYQGIIITFYIGVLLCSSFFSFVYVCSHVVYGHQSGYADDNTVLSSLYRKILNDVDRYITEDTKATQIFASKLLGELQKAYPDESRSSSSLSSEELEIALRKAKNNYRIAKEDYYSARHDAKALETIYKNSEIDYQNGVIDYQKKEEAKEAYLKAKEIRDEKKRIYDKAMVDRTDAQEALDNYKKPQNTIITEFLLEMLKSNPDLSVLEQNITELNNTIVEMGKSGNIIDNYGDMIVSTQNLTDAVNNYILLRNAASSKGEKNIKYLLEHAMDDTMSPDPQRDSFEKDYVLWRKNWEIKLFELENIIQHLPKLYLSNFSQDELSNLSDSMIDLNFLTNFPFDDYIEEIEDVRRSKISDINAIEKVTILLVGKYGFTAWFSFGLALFFDLSSLLAGLFIYGIQNKDIQNKNREMREVSD